MGAIRTAVVGVGNCASSLIQGLHHYRDASEGTRVPGLMHTVLGGYRPRDIRVVCGFDIDRRKVGRDVSEAIFADPNCTARFSDVPPLDAPVYMGDVLDGISNSMQSAPDERRFLAAAEPPADVVDALERHEVDVLVSYLPVGSEKATAYYAEAALEAGCAFVNCVPVFIASDEKWAHRFRDAGVPVLGDDIKSQVGATIVHRVLT
ncbi:MAG: inositol-3-phosphate synthase, partial [Methanobacteriota archaeon]